MTASDAVSTNDSSCSSGNSALCSNRQTNKSRDPSAWRHGGIIQTAFGVFRFAGLGDASGPASKVSTGAGTLGDDSQVTAAAAATPAGALGMLSKPPKQSVLDTPRTGTLPSEQQRQPAALRNILRTSWSSAAVVVDQVVCHYRAVQQQLLQQQQQLLQQQQQQAASLRGVTQPTCAGSWSGPAARAAELLLCSLFAIIIFIVLGLVTVYAVLARGLQLLALAVVTGVSVGIERLKVRLRQRQSAATQLRAKATAVQPLLAEYDNSSSSDDSMSIPPHAASPKPFQQQQPPDALDRLLGSESAAASKTQQDHHPHQQQQLRQHSGAVRAISLAIEQQTRPCKADSPSELQLRQLPQSQQQQASVSRDSSTSTPLSQAEVGPAAQPAAGTASQAPPAASAPTSGLASYAAAPQQYAASIIQSVHDTAEAAALAVSAYLVRAAYSISWHLLWRWQLLVAHVTQFGYKYGLILAQQLCCNSLWVIGCFTAAESSLGGSAQGSSIQARIIKLVKTGSVTAAKAGRWGLTTAEDFVSKVTSELLRDASPVTQTAVWGLAGMVRRNVVETCGLCWQLLVALSQVYMAQQQQLVAQ